MVIVRHVAALEAMMLARISAVWGRLYVKTATIHTVVVRERMITAHIDVAVEILYEKPAIVQDAVALGVMT